MKLSPVKDFTESEHVRGWLDKVAAPQFQNAVKTAMLEHARRLSGDVNAQHKLAGAHDFLDILMSLGEAKPTAQRVDTINLK